MGNSRFDDLSRALAVPASRRTVLGAVAGALVAGALGRVRPAGAQSLNPCRDAPCPPGGHLCCENAAGSVCCPPGLQCCFPANPGIRPSCCGPGFSCARGACVCQGQVCPGGRVCCGPNSSCATDASGATRCACQAGSTACGRAGCCGPGQRCCSRGGGGTTCVTLGTNENCSGCGDECGRGLQCVGGVCSCPPGSQTCTKARRRGGRTKTLCCTSPRVCLDNGTSRARCR